MADDRVQFIPNQWVKQQNLFNASFIAVASQLAVNNITGKIGDPPARTVAQTFEAMQAGPLGYEHPTFTCIGVTHDRYMPVL